MCAGVELIVANPVHKWNTPVKMSAAAHPGVRFNVNNYLWNFGDLIAKPLFDAHIMHIYKNPGVWVLSLDFVVCLMGVVAICLLLCFLFKINGNILYDKMRQEGQRSLIYPNGLYLNLFKK